MFVDLTRNIPYAGVSWIQAITAAIIILIGVIVVKIIVSVLKKGLKKMKIPHLLRTFIGRLFGIIMYIAVILIAAATLGFDVGSLTIGISAVVGIVLGFGLRDTFNNLAAGAWLASIRPFYKGEHVEVKGLEGNIQSVGLMSTEILTPDNTYITIPNQVVWGSPIINYSRIEKRRVDVKVGLSYSGDLNKAIDTALELMNKHPLILKDPAPAVTVNDLGDSAINVTLKAWTRNDDYWTVKHQLTKGVFQWYAKRGIEIPYPQIDVHTD
ncbi:MAG: mechanosensitive ion channel family protein [Thermoplasmata archaeon]